MGNYKDMNRPTTAAELRRNAEERLRTKKTGQQPPRSEEATQRLVHELEVHQIELEMQNAELRQARDDVEMALSRYTDLYDFAPVSYVTLDRNGDISAVNLTGASLIGRARSRLIGRCFGQFIAAPDRPAYTRFLGSVRVSQLKDSCETTLLNDAGQPVVVQIEAMATTSGQELRIALIDITERRHAEQTLALKQLELEEFNSSLEVRIAQSVDDLRQKDQMLILQDRRAVMGEMINNIAHQWRQPLNNVGLIIQSLKFSFDAGTMTHDELEQEIGEAMDAIMYMSRTIDDFRNFFREDKKKDSFPIGKTVQRTLEFVSNELKSRNIRILFEDDESVAATGYQNEYAQVLLNIISNSRETCIERNIPEPLIHIRITSENGRSAVYIRDNCGGIEEDIMPRIFDPYFTTRAPDKGTGIGLYMSKVIIEQNMGGHLTGENVEDRVEFRIEL